MKVIVTGSTGLVGGALVRSLLADGHEVTRLVRGGAQGFRAPGTAAVHWNPERGEIDAAALEGHDAAVHLAGEPIAEGRWDEEKKRRILESRVKGTRLLAEALAGLSAKPGVLVSASATGFYGDRGDEVLLEESASGEDFLSEVCREWEKATLPASQAGVRVVHLRIGVVLSGEGGALTKMVTPFKLGLGGKLGGGRQYMSWIALEDLIGVIRRALEDESLRGPVNAVAPGAVTNEEFTKAMGRVLGRPTFMAVPAFAARLAFGEVADAVLLAGARVEPARLKEAGYRFQYPEIEGALRHALKEDGK
ncbi:MAG TPA: TIGR01777 family oxidoreductase [Pyrinomonadaceae bacterium]|nr:TIGR01777 family oxidoreductase [Pyrinomonadaceae bacterium]